MTVISLAMAAIFIVTMMKKNNFIISAIIIGMFLIPENTKGADNDNPSAKPYLQPPMTSFYLGVNSSGSSSALSAENLRCEYAVNPLGIDSTRPRLSWILHSQQNGQRQTAYQILAASSAELLARDRGDLWDSTRVDSDETMQIPYTGQPLTS